MGIYAPLTTSGDIVVNGFVVSASTLPLTSTVFSILASCHSNMAMQTLQQTFFDWWSVLNNAVASILPARSRQETAAVEDSARQELVNRGEGELPFGVEYLVSIMDALVPLPFPAKGVFTL